MDTFGVPKKINRHVVKAIYELANQGSEKSNLAKISDMVGFSMKNNAPVANLRNVVRQSLLNLCNLGVIKKQGINYYKSPENKASFPRHPLNRIESNKFAKAVLDEELEAFETMNKKRRSLSEGSITESSKKRLRRNEPLSRKGKSVYLPKARKHTDSLTLHDVEQDLCSSSSNEHEINSEDQNSKSKTVFPSSELKLQFSSEILKLPKVEEIVFDNSYENSENLLQQLNDKSHQVETFQLNKSNDVVTNDQINGLDVLNGNESQLDERHTNDV